MGRNFARLHSVAWACLLGSLAVACASTAFVSSWKSPTAEPLKFKGEKVAAVVMMKDIASRRLAEDTLAREITSRGAEGVPMYTIAPSGSIKDEAAARTALEGANVKGVVVMRPVDVEKQQVNATLNYNGPSYGGYWGGYYAYGWGSPYSADPAMATTYTNTVVSVETLIYSLKQNQLVWGGMSKTTNPANVPWLVEEVAGATAGELEDLALITSK